MAQLNAKEIKQILAAFPHQNPNPVFCVAADGTVLYSNDACKEIFQNRCCEHKSPLIKAIIDVIKRKDAHGNLEVAMDEKHYTFTAVPIPKKNLAFVYGNDITEHREAQEQLKRLTKIIDESINIVFITDYDGAIEYVNTTFENITGFKKEECIGENPSILASGELTAADYKAMWDKIKSGKTWRGIFKNKKKMESFTGQTALFPLLEIKKV